MKLKKFLKVVKVLINQTNIQQHVNSANGDSSNSAAPHILSTGENLH